jgi:hypothetical protein
MAGNRGVAWFLRHSRLETKISKRDGCLQRFDLTRVRAAILSAGGTRAVPVSSCKYKIPNFKSQM